MADDRIFRGFPHHFVRGLPELIRDSAFFEGFDHLVEIQSPYPIQVEMSPEFGKLEHHPLFPRELRVGSAILSHNTADVRYELNTGVLMPLDYLPKTLSFDSKKLILARIGTQDYFLLNHGLPQTPKEKPRVSVRGMVLRIKH